MLRQHGELMMTMQEQSKMFAQILQQTTTPSTRGELPSTVPSMPVGLNPLTNLNLCKIAPGDAPDDFLCSFERIAVAAGWPQEQWVFRLLPCLAGESLAAFQTISPEHANNYPTVKAHILDYLGYTPEHYRLKFRATQMFPAERPKALLQRITKLAEKWLHPFLNDARALFAELIKEQLLEAVPRNIKAWVKRQNCKTLGQVLEVAEAYLDAQESTGEGSGTGPGPILKQTPREQNKGWNKKNPGKDPAFITPRPNAPSSERTCYRCGKTGHTQRFCREKRDFVIHQDFNDADMSVCQVPVRVAGKSVRALLDTGAAQSVMSRQLWKQVVATPLRSERLKEVYVKCVHGDSRRYPLSGIELEHDRTKYSLQVAILPACPFPLILGRDWPGWEVSVKRAERRDTETSVKGQSSPKLALGMQLKGGWDKNRKNWRKERVVVSTGRSGRRPMLRWVPLSVNAKAPTQAYSRAAGFDVYAAHGQSIPAKGRALVKTDLQIAPPPGSYVRIGPRSGLAAKYSVDVAAGIIDPDYRGNVCVLLVNHSESEFQVQPGDKIAQLICERIWFPKLERWARFQETSRGKKGFGSSDPQCPSGCPDLGRGSVQGEETGSLREGFDQSPVEIKPRGSEEPMAQIQQEISSLKERLDKISGLQETAWKEEVQALRQECLDSGQKQVAREEALFKDCLHELEARLGQEMGQQGQKQLEALDGLSGQMKQRMQEVENKVTDSQAQQIKWLEQVKKMQMVQDRWATEGIAPDSLAK
uniref:Uncharacterized protein LOC117355553 n=1 Tax=Geotrypetes seraphini TaxID=260995 RepID=A0A6P8QRI9_GEOSA|nr:uncharacterized protein LOC117355553 [Geotrypetes seraphini]